ncbi:phage gp36-like protein [Volucribacter psittacicida]|uniref:Phage gp36-like protein n=1 Tax=Volucribacter psittacicida TaxID=203482 RepID=A0A4R1FLP2_9PAST|nr:DUF1320 domain-containing protein [Volucribacter psittacicida]TCJ95956.1 phage gp36-like protein [Volucribacter psittacicida]
MYISVQDIKEIVSEPTLISLSNDTSRATAVDESVVERACQYASEMVDGYLRSRYPLPLVQVPTIVRHICLYLARFWLYSRRPDGKGFPDNVKQTYEQALKDLERIQAGKLHLGIAEQREASQPTSLKFKAKAPAKLDLSGY